MLLETSLKIYIVDRNLQKRCEIYIVNYIWFVYYIKNRVHLYIQYLRVENKTKVMVFLMLFAVKTGHFLGTDSLSGHQKETREKKQEARLS